MCRNKHIHGTNKGAFALQIMSNISINKSRTLVKICNFKGEQELIKCGHVLFYLTAFLSAVNQFRDRDC